MRVGVSFPTTEIGNDPNAIKAFAQGVESLGFDYLTCIDHVIQKEQPEADDWRAYYTLDNPFHEVLVMFGFLAAVTEKLELATAILILPQRPTVLVAKQLAEIDVLTQGRLRVGVGIGWNAVEFDALGQNFRKRGRRVEEQVGLLRQLWTEKTVSFAGEFDTVDDAGINPRPVQQPIPIWFGAFTPPAIQRAGRLADGLFQNPRATPTEMAPEHINILHTAAREAGRNPGDIGLDATIYTQGRGANAIRADFEAWRELGATHVTLRTMTTGYSEVDQHLEALADAKASLSGA